MITKIRHIGIKTIKFDETIDFYKKLGFKEIYRAVERWETWGYLEIVKLAQNDCCIEIIKKATKYENYYNNIHLCLQVKDLKSIYNNLEEKQKYIQPTTKFTVLVAFCKDPNDFMIELVEEINV